MISATLKIERYYSSVKEDQSPLADDAVALLAAEDYVGFFKACGPNYVRGIRRAQELTAVFKFSSTSKEIASQFTAGLKVTTPYGGGGAEFSAKSKFSSINSSLEIKIQGFGLGLNQEGADSLVATSIESYQQVLKFAFKSMTQNEDASNIGMVYGIEVVPWVNNLAFQVSAKVHDANIEIELPRSLIPKAYKKDEPTNNEFVSNERANFTCKDSTFKIDKFGYCCQTTDLYNQTTQKYNTDATMDETTAICKPRRNLDKSIVKDNMANNGEFVSRLDSAVRYKLAQMGTLEKCISSTKSFPDRFDYHILKAQDTVKYDKAIETTVTLAELKKAVDPQNNYSMLRHMTREFDEWIKMFYSPCLAALYGTNIAADPEVDPKYFMAYPWHTHNECMHLSCLTNNMRWDRVDGGCVPGLLTGTGSSDYSGTEKSCSSNLESVAATEECEVSQSDLSTFHTNVTTCWSDTLPIGSVDYLVDHFCMPQLTGDVLEGQAKTDLETKLDGTTC